MLALIFVAEIAQAKWIGPYDLGEIEVNSTVVYLALKDNGNFEGGCDAPKQIMFSDNTVNGRLVDRVLSVALTAQARETQVKVYFTTCAESGYPQATAIVAVP